MNFSITNTCFHCRLALADGYEKLQILALATFGHADMRGNGNPAAYLSASVYEGITALTFLAAELSNITPYTIAAWANTADRLNKQNAVSVSIKGLIV